MLPLWVLAHPGIHANATSHMSVMPPNLSSSYAVFFLCLLEHREETTLWSLPKDLSIKCWLKPDPIC
jgi:hypothetical protein